MKRQLIYLVMFCSIFVFGHLKQLRKVTNPWKGKGRGKEKPMENRIVGGHPATLAEFPFNVMFMNLGGMCGGTILSKKIVMTAGHCFGNNKELEEMSVISNARYTFDTRSKTHDVWHFIIHENYNKSTLFSNDIALIMIEDEFTYGPHVQRARLTNSRKWMTEKMRYFVASGWGETTYGGEVSQKGLMKTHLRYISRAHCMKINKFKLSPSMFCLYGDHERDTCRGDSGGGISWNGSIVGIVSFGNKCATTPAIYSNVFYLRPWILRTKKLLYRKFRASNSLAGRLLVEEDI